MSTFQGKNLIRKIVLENFMSHSRTVIEPADGLTVLAGPNNCGKSAVVVALQSLCYNDGHKSFVRHGEKEARVAVETDDGHKVEWIRKGDVVRYRVNGREVDRLRGRVPDDLHELLRLPKVTDDKGEEFDIHFAEQKRPIFLLDASGSKAATFFASSSDAGLLIQMQQRHKEKVRDSRREEADLARRVEAGSKVMERYEKLPALDGSVSDLEARFEEISRRSRASAELQNKAFAIEGSLRKTALLSAASEALSKIAEPPAQQDTASLAKVLERLASLGHRAACAERTCKGLKLLENPPATQEIEPLAKLTEQMRRKQTYASTIQRKLTFVEPLAAPPVLRPEAELLQLARKWRAAEEAARNAADRAQRAIADLEAAAESIRSHVRRHPTCPTCGGKLQAEMLLTGGHVHA